MKNCKFKVYQSSPVILEVIISGDIRPSVPTTLYDFIKRVKTVRTGVKPDL